MTAITPRLQIAWGGGDLSDLDPTVPRFLGGDALDPYEDLSERIRYGAGFRTRYGRDQIKELSPLMVGFLEGLLGNEDKLLSDDYTGSPLFGRVLPGLLGRFRVEAGGTVYPIFSGYTQGADDSPLVEQQSFPLRMYDAMGLFQATDVETAMYTSVRSDVAMGHVLDELGWPADKRILDTGAATFARWCATGVKGFRAIRDIVLSEGPPSIAYIDGNNNFVYEGRHYRLQTERCVTSQATLHDTGTEPAYSRYDPKRPIENIINSVTVTVYEYTTAAGATLRVAGRALPLVLGPGESVVYTVTPPSGATFFDAAVASTGVTAGSATTAFDRTSGGKATLTVTADAAGATLTSVGATGTSYTAAGTQVSNSVDASDSIAKYGGTPRTLPDDFQPRWIGTVAEAVDYGDYIVSRYQERVPINNVEVNILNDLRTAQALGRKVSDRVTLVESRTGAEDEYFVEQIERRLYPGPVLIAALGVEKAAAQAYWVLGDDVYGVLGDTTVLAF